ncbi:Tetratricopeptide repeat-containing protein, putative isoform 2 [Hibiscus syriacus]|uniref:Tetratricopeptide repeat-containing protein, putative isoform 2 n=1 Tax=Hibiscus syriacus TaxID=106335 RepID=A0A6A2WVS4_HIBSY|nr:Tetratricopeptide repeat-containing protein, putative isoform 2 [Hibiscus syriacus]
MEQDLGCGLMGGIFHPWTKWSRKSSLPALPAKGIDKVPKEPVTVKSKKPSINDSGRRRDSSVDFVPLKQPRNSVSSSHMKKNNGTSLDAARSLASSSSASTQTRLSQDLTCDPKLQKQKPNNTKALIPATASPMGNIIRKPSVEFKRFRGLDFEVLKKMGNEAYNRGRFEEALTLYEQASCLGPKKATYHCNKSAALLRLGSVMEAVVECKEAIQLDPTYCRAHHHWEKQNKHWITTNMLEIMPTPTTLLKLRLSITALRCADAQKSKEWNTLLKETQCAITSGVDSAPVVYALQTEAFLKLNRHQEAYTSHSKGTNFAVESCINFFGMAVSAYLLMIKALVFMVSGRLDDAISAAQHAARLDPHNKEITLVIKQTRAVSSARLSVLLCNRAACRSKLGQFKEAIEDCTVALKVQPSYSKARLRRADCNGKLERWEVAIQDYEILIRETPGDDEVDRALFKARIQLKKQRAEEFKASV